MVLAAIGAAGELLAAILDPAHRMPQTASQETGADLLGQEHALVAEGSAHVRRDHADALFRQAETFRQAAAHDMRHLGGGVQDQHLLPPVPDRNEAAALHGRHALARGPQRAGDLHRRGGAHPVQVGVYARLEDDIVAPTLVNERRARPPRLEHIDHRWQGLVLDFHCGREVLGLRPRRRDAHGHRFAHVTHLVRRQDRLAGGLEALKTRIGDNRSRVLEIGDGEHLALPAGRLSDGQDAGVGVGAADEGKVAHAGQAQVGDELASAAQIAVVFLAGDRLPDAVPPVRRFG